MLRVLMWLSLFQNSVSFPRGQTYNILPVSFHSDVPKCPHRTSSIFSTTRNDDDIYSCFYQISDLLRQSGDSESPTMDNEYILKQIAILGTNYGSRNTRLEGKWRRRIMNNYDENSGFSRTSMLSLSAYLQQLHSISAEEALKRIEASALQSWSRYHTQNLNSFEVTINNSEKVSLDGTWLRRFKSGNNEASNPTFLSERTHPQVYDANDRKVTERVEYTISNVPGESDDVLIVKRSFSVPISSRLDEMNTLVDGLTEYISTIEVFERDYGDYGTSISDITRVPGCIASVDVQSKVMIDQFTGKTFVQIDGSADAVLSRGLLAIISSSLGNVQATERVFGTKGNQIRKCIPTSSDILAMDSNKVADKLGLRQILSVGRNDGLASIIRVIQDQIKAIQRNDVLDIPTSDIKNSDNETEDVAMLLSGGVDSSVALNLLLQQGYSVRAFYLKIWLEDELSHLGQCPWEDDWAMCQQVCKQAGIPLEAVSLQEQYKQQVISYTIEEAAKGRTPNPDIMCNARVKFGCFFDAIEGRDFKYIATGHYARLRSGDDGIKKLFRAPDDVKDQSYFLSALNQSQLKRALFPIGDYLKSEVRELANSFDLPNKSRPDSQGLCFLGKVKFDDFLGAYLGESPGDIADAQTGDIIGKHRGLWFHTIGQRKGIGNYLDPKIVSQGPWYVVAKNPSKNLVIVSNQYDMDLFESARTEFYVEDLHWISGEAPSSLLNGETRFQLKIRHGPKIAHGTLSITTNEPSPQGLIKLDKKDGGLAPGQYVVFYNVDNSECLGSGVISEHHWATFLRSTKSQHDVPSKQEML